MAESGGTDPSSHPDWMAHALLLAREAERQGEVPVGAVVVRDGLIVGEGYNRPISAHDPTAHAEIMALRDAAARLGNYRLSDCDLYVTIEPCSMCTGAMLHARIRHLYLGAREPRAGAVLSHFGLHDQPVFNHRMGVTEGLLAEDCSRLMRAFFRRRRQSP